MANDKTLTSEDLLVRQINELQRISQENREEILGKDFFHHVEQFYNLDDEGKIAPSFRPRVSIPQLQVLTLSEATDLTDSDPRIYVTKGDTRDKPREQALQAQWRQGFFNNQIMMAELWGMLCGVGFIQVGFDPFARRGVGEIWAKSINPKNVLVDPAATSDEDWQWAIIKTHLYKEQVRQKWPDQGYRVSAKSVVAGAKMETSGPGFKLPPGPMSMVAGLPGSEQSPSQGDGRLEVRFVFLRDAAKEEIPQANTQVAAALASPTLVRPQFRPKYPNGRLIVECEGIILVDGDNPFPMKRFPLVPFFGLPPLTGFYPPPPINFSRPLQDLAGRVYTQLFENLVRLNNGVTYIPENTGIDANNFGGLPGEVHVINANSNPPVTTWPTANMPQQAFQLPQMLLDKQKELQGFTAARMGEPGAGNLSTDLYQGSIWQSKTLTRLRGRLMSESVQKLAELVFYTMAKFYKGTVQFPQFPATVNDDFEMGKWSDISADLNNYDVYLDPGSIRPMSGQALRMMVPTLVELGLIDKASALELLEVPGAGDISARLNYQAQLAALAAVNQKNKK